MQSLLIDLGNAGIGGALLSTMVEVLMRVLLYGGPCRCLVILLPCMFPPAMSLSSLCNAEHCLR